MKKSPYREYKRALRSLATFHSFLGKTAIASQRSARGGQQVTKKFAIQGYSAGLILLMAAIPESITVALHQVLQSRELMWKAILRINLPRDTLIPVSAALLVPKYGAVGLAIAYLLGKILALVSMVICVRALGLDGALTNVDAGRVRRSPA